QAADTGVTAYSVHPGAVVTQFGSGSPLIRLGTSLTGGRWGLTPAEGAAPLIALASATPLPAASGTYFDRMRPDGKVAAAGRDDAVAAELWRRSARLVGLPEADPEPAAK
ncbi:MAG: short-chain dehydrogenase, partial [Herbiconiux sp.]|nr:short-chain dehydrogenase [Herbiconiux sp.]